MQTVNQLYAQAFLNAKEGLILSNKDGIMEKVNPALIEMFGYDSEKDLEGKLVDVLIPQKYLKNHKKHREGFVKDPKDRKMGFGRVLEGQKKNGEILPLDISLSHFRTEDGEPYILLFLVDRSYRNKIELELNQLMEELEQKVKIRTADLEKALEDGRILNDLKTRFVSIVSHEFRTPLSSIFSSATLLSKYPEADQQPKRDKHINRIKRSVDHLINILDDILTINRVEEGMMPVLIESFNLPKLSEDIVEGMQVLASRGQKLTYQHIGEESFTTDKKLFQNIINNVLSNALKYSFPDGKVEFTTTLKNEELEVCIKDYGIGIPIAEQEKLFSRFFRAGNVLNIEGTGLGLNIVKKYVELLKGTISFKSTPEKETEFKIKIPKL